MHRPKAKSVQAEAFFYLFFNFIQVQRVMQTMQHLNQAFGRNWGFLYPGLEKLIHKRNTSE
jgi:hypothetical protein